MYEIRIPDALYRQALRAAQVQHVTLQQFVSEALRLHLQDDEDAAIQSMFTTDRLEHIAKADAEIDAGSSFSAEQVDEHFAKKHNEWLHRKRA